VAWRYVVDRDPLREVTYTLDDAVWQAFYRYDAALRTLASQSGHQDLDGSYGRLAMKALRLAGLLASLHDEQQRHTIELAHWHRGQQIAERWRASLHRLVAQLGEEVAPSREQTIETRMEQALRRFGALSIRELKLKTRLSYAELNKTIAPMLEVGAVAVDPEASERTTRYRLVYQSQNGGGPHEP
jgi:hypothetical protein